MEWLKSTVEFLVANWDKISVSILALVAFLEALMRLWPTSNAAGFVERLGVAIRKILDFVKVPNNVKKPE